MRVGPATPACRRPSPALALEHSDLTKDGRVIPVDALGGHLAVAERDHEDDVDLDVLAGGRYPGQEPVHLLRVPEAEQRLLDDVGVGGDLVQDDALAALGDRGDEVVAVERTERGLPFASPT